MASNSLKLEHRFIISFHEWPNNCQGHTVDAWARSSSHGRLTLILAWSPPMAPHDSPGHAPSVGRPRRGATCGPRCRRHGRRPRTLSGHAHAALLLASAGHARLPCWAGKGEGNRAECTPRSACLHGLVAPQPWVPIQ